VAQAAPDIESPAWASDGRITAALLLLPFLVLLPAALVRGVFYLHDIQYYFYPYHAVQAALLHQGELPLWNPYAFSGMPLIGDGQTAMFYPPNWLFFILPGAAALNYDVLLQFSIAGAGMFLFGRHLGAGRLPATIGALAYMFCGFLTSRVVHLSIQSGAAMIPLVFLGVDRDFQAGTSEGRGSRTFVLRRRSRLAAAGAAVAVQSVTGHPQVPIYTALALGVYALVHGIAQWRAVHDWRWLYRPAIRLALIYVLAYSLAAIQLVPWVELGRFSPRAAGASFFFVLGNSMNGGDWLLMLFPYLNGSFGPTIYGAEPQPLGLMIRTWEHSGYVGILPLGLAAFALLGAIRRPDIKTLQFGLLLLGGTLFVAGRYTPVGDVIYHLPVVGRLREVERAMALVDFALVTLAVLGAQRLVAMHGAKVAAAPTDTRWQRQALFVAAGILLLPLLVVVIGQVWGFPRSWRVSPQAMDNLRLARPAVLIPLLFALASAALLWFWSRPGSTRLALRLATVLVLLDLGSYAGLFNPLAASDLYSHKPDMLAALPGADQPFRKATMIAVNDLGNLPAREALGTSWSMVFGVEDVNGFNSLQSRRYTDYLFGPEIDDVSYGLLDDARLLRRESPVLNALNVRYLLVTPGAPGPIDAGYRHVYGNPNVEVFENLSAYPRAFFVDTARVENDARTELRTVTADGFDGRREALLETAQPPVLAPAAGPAAVIITRRGANGMALTTDTTAPRLLVLSEMYYPGWRATVDGAATPIYRTNYLFRGIVVPAGHHDVEFAYRPASVAIGASISLAALALCGAFVWRGREA
jgi:hypothetical protein